MTIAVPRPSRPQAEESRTADQLQRWQGEAEQRRDGLLRHHSIGAIDLEGSGHLPEVVLAYETWGTLNSQADNAVLIQHALTGSSHVTRGCSDEDGWWEPLVGPGRAIDTTRFFVVAVNILGGCNGSTGPSSAAPDGKPWGSRFPFVTLRDAARAEARLADALGIQSWFAVVGGSMGGARALEWAASFPQRVQRCAVISIGAHSTAEQIALAEAQISAIRLDPDFAGGDYYDGPAPEAGLALARRIAHISYRSEAELQARFGRNAQGDEQPLNATAQGERGRYQVESYLQHQGQKLVRRFDANSYIALTEALMSHDVGRGRGGVRAALSQLETEFFVAAVDSDRLYLPQQSAELAEAIAGEVSVHTIHSGIGHDGFLTEAGQVGEALKSSLFRR